MNDSQALHTWLNQIPVNNGQSPAEFIEFLKEEFIANYPDPAPAKALKEAIQFFEHTIALAKRYQTVG